MRFAEIRGSGRLALWGGAVLWAIAVAGYGAGRLGASGERPIALALEAGILAVAALAPLAGLRLARDHPPDEPAIAADLEAVARRSDATARSAAAATERLAALEATVAGLARSTEPSADNRTMSRLADLEARLSAIEGALQDVAWSAERSAPEPPPAAAEDDAIGQTATQPQLPLEPAGARPLTLAESIDALNFPRDANDRGGFEILRRALAQHDLARLLQASEDCLNFMAQQALYMDDLLPAPATAAEWRQFAKGGAARAELMPLSGISDRRALDTVRSRMRADPIFRDCALHFQRLFDHMLHDLAPQASDEELLRLLDTRSGRAFVLLAQVSGMRVGGAAAAEA